MNPRHGEVWLVDMGLAAKIPLAVVLIAGTPRSQGRESKVEIA